MAVTGGNRVPAATHKLSDSSAASPCPVSLTEACDVGKLLRPSLLIVARDVTGQMAGGV